MMSFIPASYINVLRFKLNPEHLNFVNFSQQYFLNAQMHVSNVFDRWFHVANSKTVCRGYNGIQGLTLYCILIL